MDVLVGEDCASNYKVVVETKISKALAVVVHCATAVLAHGSFIVGIVCSYLGIHVADNKKHVVAGNPG